MLYITRKIGERIVLSDKDSGKTIATLTVEDFLADHIVHFGVEAPQTVKIDRDYNHGVKHASYANKTT